MTKPLAPLDRQTILARASAGLGKVDLYGTRGLTMISMHEIEAMALALAAFGLVPTPPGGPLPPAFILTPEGEVK